MHSSNYLNRSEIFHLNTSSKLLNSNLILPHRPPNKDSSRQRINILIQRWHQILQVHRCSKHSHGHQWHPKISLSIRMDLFLHLHLRRWDSKLISRKRSHGHQWYLNINLSIRMEQSSHLHLRRWDSKHRNNHASISILSNSSTLLVVSLTMAINRINKFFKPRIQRFRSNKHIRISDPARISQCMPRLHLILAKPPLLL
mmetsp:Transcript_3424/g.5270  ORF Transcript_3424/g.5270 Transcript_3424/m.5270 type:complete len:200 (-) Transcript_3424:143-742(-)